MKVWITKYALTRGLYQVEVDEPSAGMMVTEVHNRLASYQGIDWYTVKQDAIARVRAMIEIERNRLERALLKLRQLEREMDKEEMKS